MPESKKEKEEFSMKNAELKMPEDNFIETEPEIKQVSTFPVMLVAIILILIGILGALLWWGAAMLQTEPVEPEPVAARPTPEENNEPESTNAEASVQITETISTSNEINTIEADIQSTDIDGVDSEMTTINAELKALGI